MAGNWSTTSARSHNSAPYPHRDNGDTEAKLIARRSALVSAPARPAILDCFAGEGNMFARVWRDAAGEYLGMDQRFFRPAGDPAGECWRGNNAILIRRALARRSWDIVDLDSYANPWPLLRLVLNMLVNDRVVVVATCSMDRAVRGGTGDFAAAVAGASALSYHSLLTRWYDDVIRWALQWATLTNGFSVERARRIRAAHNPQVRYWLIEFSRPSKAVAPVAAAT